MYFLSYFINNFEILLFVYLVRSRKMANFYDSLVDLYDRDYLFCLAGSYFWFQYTSLMVNGTLDVLAEQEIEIF